jgi:hypothetical protein
VFDVKANCTLAWDCREGGPGDAGLMFVIIDARCVLAEFVAKARHTGSMFVIID